MDFEGSFGPFGEKNVIWPVTVSSVKSKSHPVFQERGKKYKKKFIEVSTFFKIILIYSPSSMSF